MMNIIASPRVYDRYRQITHTIRLLLVQGTVQQETGVTNLLVEHLSPLRNT